MKNLIVFVIVIAVLVFATVTFLDYRSERKYKECSRECLFITLDAKNECGITCLKKYK